MKHEIIAELLRSDRSDLARYVGATKPQDDVGSFWVVTYPTPNSTLIDFVFETDVPGLILQARGGLAPQDIAGIFRTKMRAIAFAKKLAKNGGV